MIDVISYMRRGTCSNRKVLRKGTMKKKIKKKRKKESGVIEFVGHSLKKNPTASTNFYVV